MTENAYLNFSKAVANNSENIIEKKIIYYDLIHSS